MTDEQNEQQHDFAEGENDEVATKVGSVGWPDNAENEEGVGASGERLGDDERSDKLDEKRRQERESTQQPEMKPESETTQS